MYYLFCFRYPFKFVLDGVWTASLDHPTYKDGDNTNNYIDVLPKVSMMVALVVLEVWSLVRSRSRCGHHWQGQLTLQAAAPLVLCESHHTCVVSRSATHQQSSLHHCNLTRS